MRRFPPVLQREIEEERPDGSLSDRWEFANIHMRYWTPRTVELTPEFLAKQHLPHWDAIKDPDSLLDVWDFNKSNPDVFCGMDFQKIEDYSRLPGSTANPSVMVDGEIWFGCHRVCAAIRRGDKIIRVWDLVTRK